jgi:hypothetical protein
MSTEELLKPRYKVIADWPMNHFYEVDDIIEMKLMPNGKYWNGEDSYYLTEKEMEKHPHLFKKLEWWEERKIEDMPDYLCCVCTDFIKFVKGQIIKVEKHQSNTFNKYVPYLFISKEKQSHEAVTNCFLYKDFYPATEEEYNRNQQSINKQQ